MHALGKRILTAGVLLPVVIFGVSRGPAGTGAILCLIAVLGAIELARLVGTGAERVTFLPGAAAAVLWIAARAGLLHLSPSAVLAASFLIVMAVELFRPGGRMLAGMSFASLAILYLGVLPAHLIGYYDLGRAGLIDARPVFFVMAAVWGCDTAAYIVGNWIGRHRLWPRVSPGKSWEGAIAGLAASVLIAVLAGAWLPRHALPARLGAGFLVAIASQLGDLAESLMKRERGIKDAGSILPGHGGVLDRLDSLIVAAPVLYYWLRLTVREL